MAFRAVRTAAVGSLVLVLAAGCGQDQQNRDGLPEDRTQLSLQDLDRLPWYGAQRRPCRQVESYLEERGGMPARDTVEITLEGDELLVEPPAIAARLDSTLHWHADSLVWVASFQEISPLVDSALMVRGQAAKGRSGQAPPVRTSASTVITGDEAGCGRYYYSVAAYRPSEPGRLYLADPILWVY